MASSTSPSAFTNSRRFQVLALGIALLVGGVIVWVLLSRGKESTDDAQVDADVTPIAARVGGTVIDVPVRENQAVDQGTLLVALDQRDYEVAVDHARAELADAEATLAAARDNVPITATTATSGVTSAQGSLDQARGGVDTAERQVEAARARLTSAQARTREAEANASKSARDVERLRGLLAKDEVSQQQFDAVVAAAEAQRAAADAAKSQVVEAEVGIRVAESQILQAKAGQEHARGTLESTGAGAQHVAAARARVQSAEARVTQAQATLAQSELNLRYTRILSPAKGIVSKKNVHPGQVIQAGQPAMALVQNDPVWITANFKETQLTDMRPGQRVVIDVDASGGKRFTGHVDSIAAATGARFSLLPPENATGNFVKVVQRVPVKIVLDAGQDPDHLLRPGLSVTPTVYTR
jgi:membrane fusion protein (multidrug efflux system)